MGNKKSKIEENSNDFNSKLTTSKLQNRGIFFSLLTFKIITKNQLESKEEPTLKQNQLETPAPLELNINTKIDNFLTKDILDKVPVISSRSNTTFVKFSSFFQLFFSYFFYFFFFHFFFFFFKGNQQFW